MLAMSLVPGGEVVKPKSLLKGQLGSLVCSMHNRCLQLCRMLGPYQPNANVCSNQRLRGEDEMLC